jgi:hypothetical protein
MGGPDRRAQHVTVTVHEQPAVTHKVEMKQLRHWLWARWPNMRNRKSS